MSIKKIKTSIIFSAIALASQVTMAHGVKCGDLNIAHPYSTPTIGSGNTGAVYFMNIKNNGKDVDQLIGARTDASSSVEIHEMSLENNIMKMRAIPEVQLPSGFEVTFKHGQANGYHLMLIDLKKPLKLGDKFPVTLKFKTAGECKAEVWVEAPKGEAHKH
jgi:copper(I)-binding protein